MTCTKKFVYRADLIFEMKHHKEKTTLVKTRDNQKNSYEFFGF